MVVKVPFYPQDASLYAKSRGKCCKVKLLRAYKRNPFGMRKGDWTEGELVYARPKSTFSILCSLPVFIFLYFPHLLASFPGTVFNPNISGTHRVSFLTTTRATEGWRRRNLRAQVHSHIRIPITLRIHQPKTKQTQTTSFGSDT